MKTKFIPKPNGGLNKKTAIVVGRELLAIQKSQGVIKPETVVKSASNPQSPLHRFFNWDNDDAAQKYREWQARQLIGAVHVIVVGDESKPAVRAFVNVRPVDGDEMELPEQGYVSTASIVGRKPYEDQVVQFAHEQLLRWRQKFGEIEAFFGIVHEIDKIQIQKPRKKAA